MRRLADIIDRLSIWTAGASAVILGLMTALILLEILMWNTIEKSIMIADEYSAYGLAAIIFLGAGYCLKQKGHIRITLVLGLLPARLSRVITFAATAFTTLFMGILWLYLLDMVRATWRYHSTSGTLTQTPLWIPQGIMMIGATGFLLQLLGTTIRTWYAVDSGEDVI